MKTLTWFQFRNLQWHKNCCVFIPTMWFTKCNSYFQFLPFYFFPDRFVCLLRKWRLLLRTDYSITWFQFRNLQWHKNCCAFIPTMWSTKCNYYFQLFAFHIDLLVCYGNDCYGNDCCGNDILNEKWVGIANGMKFKHAVSILRIWLRLNLEKTSKLN